MAKATFDTLLTQFTKSMATSMKLARQCSEMGLRHFEETGDVVYIQRFFDAMPSNFSRKAAFKMWVRDHSPITMEGGKFKKDQSENANAFKVEAACEQPFWVFAPEQEQVLFGVSDVVTKLRGALKSFHRDNQSAKDDQTLEVLSEAEELVENFAKKREAAAS